MNKNDILIAIDPCVMDELEEGVIENSLTVGKEYKVELVEGQTFKIYDDQNEIHGFDIPTYREFFIRKEKDYDKVIDLMKADIWKRITLLPKENTSDTVDIQERTIHDDGNNYSFIIEDNELYDQLTQQVIDYKQLCVEDLIFLLETWELEIQ